MGPTLTVSDQVHYEKYRGAGETFRSAATRIADGMKDSPEHFHALRDALLDMRILPAGRVQSALGSPRQVTPVNCFVGRTIEDSMEGIMEAATECATTLRMGGGWGSDFSTIRPRGDLIRSLQSTASGPISFMSVFNSVCGTVCSAGHRRGAMMGILRVDHPDILDFIAAKRNESSLTNFNISVAVTDDFMRAVEADAGFDLKFNGRIYSTVRASDLWAEIMRSTWDWAEPGIIFIDGVNRQNNLWYCETIAATNPCFTGDTEVLTPQGYKRLDGLVGKTISVWNGEEWSKVQPRVTGANQPIVRVTLSNGVSLRCTPYHRFITTDGEIQAGDLKPGTKLAKFSMPVINGGQDNSLAWVQGLFSGDGHFTKGLPYVHLYGEKRNLWAEFPAEYVKQNPLADGDDRTIIKLSAIMQDKNFVPTVTWSRKARLAWFAGLCDADGTVTRSDNNVSIQVVAVDRGFLDRVRKMLTTLGVQAKISLMHEAADRVLPDGTGGSSTYYCQATYRLLLAGSQVAQLQAIGFSTLRLDLSGNSPQREATQFTKVVSVEPAGMAEQVYCFNEPIAHRGTFEGVVTGQCAEQPLPPFGACLLGSFNLVRYVFRRGHGLDFDFDQFRADIRHFVRGMDNIIDGAIYPLPEQRAEEIAKRRMGLGVTGAANAIEAMGHPYGSEGFVAVLGLILECLRDTAYETSCQLAEERGAFPKFEADLYAEGNFIKTLPAEIQDRIKTSGIRNSHLTSIAPTGTISMTADNVSSGIEPVFAHEYDRTLIMPDGPRVYRMQDYGLARFGIRGKTAGECSVQEHIAVLCAASALVDSAVSKTCNVGPSVTWGEFQSVYFDAWRNGAKSCSTFRINGKRGGVLQATEPAADGAACQIDPATGAKSCDA